MKGRDADDVGRSGLGTVEGKCGAIGTDGRAILPLRNVMKALDSILGQIRQFIVDIRNPADLRKGEAAWMRGDHESAISIFMPLAEQGCAHAQYCLGKL